MMWPTLGSRTAKEQNRTDNGNGMYRRAGLDVTVCAYWADPATLPVVLYDNARRKG